jgi:hypothetical protein
MDQLAPLLIIPVLLAIGVFSLFRMGILGKKMLPTLPSSGPLPVADLARYYELRDTPIAWERVRGWALNEPVNLEVTAPIDHVVLTTRVLDFCSGASGKLTLVFNFLVGAISQVTFEAAPVGAAAPGQRLVTVFTPSGQTRMLATPDFAHTLQQAVTKARAQG